VKFEGKIVGTRSNEAVIFKIIKQYFP